MNTDNYIYLILIILLPIILTSFMIWRIEKNSKIIKKKINEESKHNEQNLETMNDNIGETNKLLTTYKKTIEEKSHELKKYKEGAEIAKTKGVLVSLIGILEFVEQFEKKSKDLDENSKNYIEAIKDKMQILLINSGVEIFKPELNKNVLDVQGCSSNLLTKKTKDPSKINLIANVIKPGYKFQVRTNDFIFLKNAEVEVYELEN